MNKLLVTLVVLLVVGVGAFFLISGDNETGNAELDGEDNDGVKTFVMTGENFKFIMNDVENPDIRVKQGDIVRIEFRSTQGFHDWVVDEFDAATEKVRDTDDSTFVEYIADKTGTFEYYCSVGQHRANGMKGRLIVE